MSHLVDYDDVCDTRDDPRWSPLRVTCELLTPVLGYDDGLNLDGPLQFGAYGELDDDQRADLPPLEGPWVADFEIPAARWTAPLATGEEVDDRLTTADGKVWGWCTSDAQVEWEGRQPYAFRGKAPGYPWARLTDAKSVNTASGRYKGTDLRFEGLWPAGGQLVWYVLGDAEGVRRLLRHVPNIGKKHNVGHGKIKCDLAGVPEWRVEEIDDDYSIRRDGRLTRSMPFGFAEGAGSKRPIRAPNWHRSRYVLCVR